MEPSTAVRPPAAPDQRVLGRYRLTRRLGAGGCGTVWRATDEKLDREVAIKVVDRDGSQGDDRTLREAQAAARLAHPAIVALYETGEDDHATYLVSELVRGRTLAQLLKEGRLSDRDVVRIGLVLCDALGHAHERGVVHRDVKPGNVMIPAKPAGGAAIAKLTDFGIAHLGGGQDLTRTGDVLGTLAYMAPEQAAGRRVGPATDLYSLGLVLYEGLAGVNPVRAASPAATARRLGRPLPPLARTRPDLPPALCAALDRTLAPDPFHRGSLADLAGALHRAVAHLGDEPGTVIEHPVDAALARSPSPRLIRAAGALGTGGLGATVLAIAGPAPPASPVLAAIVLALTALAAPRAAWLLAAGVLLGWLVLPPAGLTGVAFLALPGIAVVPLLLRRAPATWSLPALAPMLGLAGLAAAFPLLAALPRRAATRAGLGAAGALWLLLAEPLGGRTLLFGAAVAGRPRRAWEDDAAGAASHALAPLVTSGALALALLWALAAALLPWLVRGRSAPADVIGATMWTAGLLTATQALGAALTTVVPAPEPGGIVVATVLAGVLAVVVAALRGPAAGPAGDTPVP